MFRLIILVFGLGLIFAPQFFMRILAWAGLGLLWTGAGTIASFIPSSITFVVVAIFSGASEKDVFNGIIPAVGIAAALTIPLFIIVDLILKIHMSEVIFGSWFNPEIYTDGFKYWFIEACDFAILNIGPTAFLGMAYGSNSKD